jgi:hypothetical protein
MSLTGANGSVRWVGLRPGRGVVVCRSGNSKQGEVTCCSGLTCRLLKSSTLCVTNRTTPCQLAQGGFGQKGRHDCYWGVTHADGVASLAPDWLRAPG